MNSQSVCNTFIIFLRKYFVTKITSWLVGQNNFQNKMQVSTKAICPLTWQAKYLWTLQMEWALTIRVILIINDQNDIKDIMHYSVEEVCNSALKSYLSWNKYQRHSFSRFFELSRWQSPAQLKKSWEWISLIFVSR